MQWYDSDRFGQVALADLKPGDVVHLPAMWGRQPAGWRIEAHKIERAEQKSDRVWFLYLAPESIKAGHMPFTMLCGHHLTAGVLRRQPTPHPVEDPAMHRPVCYLADHEQSGRALFSDNTEARSWIEHQTGFHHPGKATRWVDGGHHGWQALRLPDGTTAGHVYALQLDGTLPDDANDED